MRRLLLFAFVLSLLACVPRGAAAPFDDDDYSNVRIVRLSLVEGQVQVFRPERGAWEDALVNLPIQKSYAVATGRGRVEVEFESGATARLDEGTELEFTELALVGGARVTQLRLERGSALFYANLDRRDTFEVLTDSYRVKVPRNARLRVDATDEGVLVSVLKGDVSVESDRGSYRVSKNQELYLTADAGPQFARRGETTEFERWALDREEVLSASREESQSYVNAPFRYGVGDLSRYGYWYSNATYGSVWYPYAAGFVPYVNGNWIWVNGFGWSWVGYEPWGWLPYHYGRWVWTGYNWGWVPGYFRGWRPAHVAWLRFGDGSLGWCPLGPRDRHGRRPTHLGVVTAVMTGGRPVVRSGPAPTQVTFADAPTRDSLDALPRFGGRTNPVVQRAGRGGMADTSASATATPRSGFSGATHAGDAPPRASQEVNSTGRMPVPRGDVRFDRSQDKFVNTPMREPVGDAAENPRSGWSGASGRPQPSFPRGEGPRAGSTRGSGISDGGRPSTAVTVPRNSGEPRGTGFSGRTPQTSGQRPASPPRATPPPRYTPPSPPRQSAPPRPSSPPPARPSSAPSRPAPQATRPAPAPRPSPQTARPPKQPSRSSSMRPAAPRPSVQRMRPVQPTRRPAPAPKRPNK